ncbi:arylalkylamine N-acetyltransferase 1-like [Choristoneura fumiferana]|uniref:arylalkylamine N-acetyltransferase 1-like n=1 Tax=Choristoneura fumiferana TaxID=7141 RepID=UPI003D15DC99
MFLIALRKRIPTPPILFYTIQFRKCHSVFGIKELIHQEKPDHIIIDHIATEQRDVAVAALKQLYLSEHVLVRARRMDLHHDNALDEYLYNLLKQGNSIWAKTVDDTLAGICVNFASSPADPRNLRNYAFYRQDPNTKDFLYFTAKLQETPNLWKTYNVPKIFEIKMLAVIPELRRLGLATMLAEKSKELARDQGYNVVRMDCINPYDYKIAERCMLHCVLKYPLHKLRGAAASFIPRGSEHNRVARVYAGASAADAPDTELRTRNRREYESLLD